MMQLRANTVYTTTLSGGSEVPPNASTATGTALLTLNGDSLLVNVSFANLNGGTAAAAHIHCCTTPGMSIGVAVPFNGFPADVSGMFTGTFDLASDATYTDGFLMGSGGTAAGAEAALIAGLNAGTAYVNIHNATFPAGEIRGFVETVPEPGSLALLGLGVLGLAAARRTRRKLTNLPD